MTSDEIVEILETGKRIHKGFISSLDFNKNSVAKAVYILQGGAITTVYNALKFNLSGHIVAREQQGRMISEIEDIIDFFATQDDNSRHIKSWYAGITLNITDIKRGMHKYMDEATASTYINLMKDLLHEKSKYLHPSLDAVRFNMRKSSHEFDYECVSVYGNPNYVMTPNKFATMFIAPGILYSLLIPAKILTPTEEDFTILSNYADEIEKLPKK